MKEKYFTLQNIENESEILLSQSKKYRVKNNFSFYPERSALLILDMQNFFLDKDSHAYIPASKAIIPNVKLLANLYTNAGLPVVFTRHINTNTNAGLMKSWWRDIIQGSSVMSEINPELLIPDAYIINKTQYDAFYKTNLEKYLTKNKITQLVITGVMTHLCCETTIRSAFVRGFEIFFPVDATATYNLEFHRSTFINLSHGFAVPVMVKDLKESMENLKVVSA